MSKQHHFITLFGALLMIVALCPNPASGQTASNKLPDWSGVWQMVGPTIFDGATVEPKNGRAGYPGVRERPPYNPEWEATYLKNIDAVRKGLFPDPVTTCGTPHGFPRIMNVPDVYEFALTQQQTWILTENGPGILRIYTDGREHPKPEDRWATYTGDSVGRWEGDTLVFDTVAVKGWSEKDTILDRTGIVMSDQMRAVTRMRKVDDNTLEAQIAIDDPKALTKTWNVTKRYRRLPAGTRVYDYGCAENNRNPVSESGKTLTLGSDGKPIDRTLK
jgi:hypothetical protein